jgi:outer membrane immunogenic protein
MNWGREKGRAMKKLLLASTAILCSGAAFGSDLPPRVSSKAAMAYAAAPAPFSWTGCYAGAHAGAGWSRTDYTDPTGFNIAPLGDAVRVNGGAGFVGGGQVGCDHQFASNWVVGLAGDFSWASIQGQTNDPFFAGKGPPGTPLPLHSRTDFLASATGRVGYAWDRYLVYAKGGAALSHNKYEANNFGCIFLTPCNVSASDTPFGWTAGAGLEWAFAPNWSALVEYDHYGFASKDLTFIDPAHPTAPAVFAVKQDFDVVKLGINYRFGGLLR